MPRKRFQRGSVRPRKHGRRKVWVAQWRENGDRRSKVLGMCSEIPKSQAETMLNSDPSATQRREPSPGANLHIQTLRREFISAGLSPEMEGINTKRIGTGHLAPPGSGIQQPLDGFDQEGRYAKAA